MPATSDQEIHEISADDTPLRLSSNPAVQEIIALKPESERTDADVIKHIRPVGKIALIGGKYSRSSFFFLTL
ncbi:unnamed protein product [Enterobius vermicularis]|uniref:Plug domain-containing protein n=1 Tax=Enterobius vermicularis TaxID=51028 RepID=A0A0N4V8M8_ENTVE|nr:unnamed protein product [Enterobius vermicularis]